MVERWDLVSTEDRLERCGGRRSSNTTPFRLVRCGRVCNRFSKGNEYPLSFEELNGRTRMFGSLRSYRLGWVERSVGTGVGRCEQKKTVRSTIPVSASEDEIPETVREGRGTLVEEDKLNN